MYRKILVALGGSEEWAVLMISAHCTQPAASATQSASDAVKEPS
jgi:hypothetical protein